MSNTKGRALILGVGGQDGSYLADLLHERGYEVHGLYRHNSSPDPLWRLAKDTRTRIGLHKGDVTDIGSFAAVCDRIRPTVIFNVADQDNVGWSKEIGGVSIDVTASAVFRMLEHVHRTLPGTRWFQPCSATMFGYADPPQTTKTRFDPQSPYAVAKTAAWYITKYFRDHLHVHASSAILYNHDSPRRTESYFINSLCGQVVRTHLGLQPRVTVGNKLQKVEVGHAKDFMTAAILITEYDLATDSIIGQGYAMSVEQWAGTAVGILQKVLSLPEYPRIEIVYDPARTSHGELRSQHVEFAEQYLGWRKQYNSLELLEEIIRAKLEQYQGGKG